MSPDTVGAPLRRYAFHPLLIAAFPVLFLWAQNRDEVRFGDGVADALLLSLGTTFVCFAVASLLLRDHRRGAVGASGLAFLALSYGHVRSVLPQAIAAPEVLLTASAVLGVLVVVAAIRVRAAVGDITHTLNLVALVRTAEPIPVGFEP